MPRDFLFGTVRVPMWDYYWGLTAAQVELLTIDQPLVVYKADPNKEKPWKDGSVTEDYANKAYQRWLERKQQRDKNGTGLNLNEGLQGVRKIDFNEYLRSGEKIEID